MHEVDVSAVSAGPGDVVVVRSELWRMTQEQMQALHDEVKRHFPDNNVLVLDCRLQLDVQPSEN